MPRSLLLVAALAVPFSLVHLGASSQAQPEQPDKAALAPRNIVCTGSATVTGKPDRARIHLRVVTLAKTVAAAREENARLVRKVHTTVDALKLDKLQSGTVRMDVEITHEQNAITREKVFVGYTASNSFTFLVQNDDLDKLTMQAAKVADAALENGGTELGEVEFFKADDTELRRQAMTKASADALANARAYAAGANLQIQRVTHLEGARYVSGIGIQGGGIATSHEGLAASLSAGHWRVTADVTITCQH